MTITTTPRERPILFSAPMVSAILDGRKTMTRRVVKASAWHDYGDVDDYGKLVSSWEVDLDRCPYGLPGDRLWVKEKFKPLPMQVPTDGTSRWLIQYAAGGQRECDAPAGYNPMLYNYERWTSSLFMPRWASRITLAVTEVRVERLQAISEADCWAEAPPGLEFPQPPFGYACNEGGPKRAFRDLWKSINGVGSWDVNPWVWAISFRRV